MQEVTSVSLPSSHFQINRKLKKKICISYYVQTWTLNIPFHLNVNSFLPNAQDRTLISPPRSTHGQILFSISHHFHNYNPKLCVSSYIEILLNSCSLLPHYPETITRSFRADRVTVLWLSCTIWFLSPCSHYTTSILLLPLCIQHTPKHVQHIPLQTAFAILCLECLPSNVTKAFLDNTVKNKSSPPNSFPYIQQLGSKTTSNMPLPLSINDNKTIHSFWHTK